MMEPVVHHGVQTPGSPLVDLQTNIYQSAQTGSCCRRVVAMVTTAASAGRGGRGGLMFFQFSLMGFPAHISENITIFSHQVQRM